MPSFSICRYQATDMAMIATTERSMPRPMMIIAMPTARMPSTLTLRTIATRLSAEKKPRRPTDADQEQQDRQGEDDPLLGHAAECSCFCHPRPALWRLSNNETVSDK